ncbi:MAG: TonB-dependent receptor [Bacteroidota bacterium]
MKRIFIFLLLILSVSVFAQKGEIRGTVKDPTTGETIIGANIVYGPGKGTVTDINGNFSIPIDSAGTYNLVISYVGYEPQKMKVKVADRPVILSFELKQNSLDEVEVVADVAKTRETPIAFSNVSQKQIEEELGVKDLPMVLNTTPGAYATEQGGGNGDARINMRGFDQRYIAVMVDGVPVNDMENGAVYWSNWDGLGGITRSMQVQRGLGASKLALPSVGGTINILTNGIDQKMGASIKQEFTDYGLYKTSFGYNSGQLKGGWGFALAGSRKWGTEWADGTYVDGWSYFMKVQKRFKKHLFSFSVNGAPQAHGQRYTRMPIAVLSKQMAQKLGINADSVLKVSPYTNVSGGERGLKYNPDWGMLNGKEFSAEFNFFHKPAFNLSHFWTPNDKLTVSTVAYLSIGTGGGAYMINPGSVNRLPDGTQDMQSVYDGNSKAKPVAFYSSIEHASTNYLRAQRNDHIWYGVLSSWNYQVNRNLTTLVGIDGRYYKGTHFRTPLDLMGGDFAIDYSDKNQPVGTGNGSYYVKKVGDKISFYNDNKVMWGGVFGQAEYKKNKWSVFITATVSDKSFQRIDYFKPRDLVIDGITFPQAVGYGQALYYNGSSYLISTNGTSTHDGESTVVVNGDTTFLGTGIYRKYILNAKRYTNQSAEARPSTTDKKWYVGYTFKGGANYNINDHHNVFINLGYMNMAPNMNAVFDNSNKLFAEIKNQRIYAIEGGYGIKYPRFVGMLNLYYTYWKDKPVPTPPPVDGVTFNINGIDAIHKGVEFEGKYQLLKKLETNATIAIADWRTVSAATAYIVDDAGNILTTVNFSAKNVHVGDAAQLQLGGSLRYEVIKHLYIKPRYMFFGKHYANFDPSTLYGATADRESWKMPSYGLFDLFLGYDIKYWKLKFSISAGVSNVLNTVYITDGANNLGGATNFDANSALVYMGMGRRMNVGLKIGF